MFRKPKYAPRHLQEKPDTLPPHGSLLWVWEFSKKAVLICTAIYVAAQLYAMAAMWYFQDFTYLGTLIEQTSDILRGCVFGYLIKAGLENIVKIYWNSGPRKETEDQPQGADALPSDTEPPDF